MKALYTTFVLSALFIITFTSGSWSKDCDSSCTVNLSRHYGFMGIGETWFTNKNMNNKLLTLGQSRFTDNALSVSLGGHKEVKRMITESVITGQFWRDNIDNDLRTSLFTGDIFWNSGYNFFDESKLVSLFPYSGLGFSMNAMRIRTDTKTLSGLLTSTEPNSYLWQGAFLINLGLGSDFVLRSPDNKKGLSIGLRAGYTYDLYTQKNWTSDGISITDVPPLRHNGGYVRLILGGWGKHEHMEKSHD